MLANFKLQVNSARFLGTTSATTKHRPCRRLDIYIIYRSSVACLGGSKNIGLLRIRPLWLDPQHACDIRDDIHGPDREGFKASFGQPGPASIQALHLWPQLQTAGGPLRECSEA